MKELTLDVAALERLPEVESVELGGCHGCGLATCVVSCLSTGGVHVGVGVGVGVDL